jgi:NAD(P)-dependent dehydrogenase (short-subunit alcohol dehydrogenase family)
MLERGAEEPQKDRLERPVVLVTGANGAIGEAICAGMAEHGYEVVMACRNSQRAEEAAARIRRQVPTARLRTEIVDVSRRGSIDELARHWRGPLRVLINNAAIAPRRRTETADGIEMQFATNVLGYVWMMRAFAPHLRGTAPARIVNVASYWAGGLDFDDLEFKRRPYDNNAAYRQSKQANRMLTVAFAKRFSANDITVNACHPGDASSALSASLGFGGSETPSEAADTPVWLATDPVLAGITGKYFANRQMRLCEFARDETAIAALDALCARF